MSSPTATYPDPFTPSGSIDGNVTTSDLAGKMTFWARFGRGCGASFDSEKFVKEHSQWAWEKRSLKAGLLNLGVYSHQEINLNLLLKFFI